MKVHEIMSEPVVTCTPQVTLGWAARLMRDADCGILPVVDTQGHLAGLITDRDICLAIAGSADNPVHIAVDRVMTRKPLTVTGSDSIHKALSIMKSGRVRRLPVVDLSGRLTGLLSIDDVIVRGLETGGISSDEVVLALRTMFERRLAALEL